MNGGRLVIALAVALIGAATAAAQAPPSADALGVLVNQVLALFPKVEGEVLEVQAGKVTLTVGRRDGLQPGIELSLYREGRELRHPRTGAVLGRAEEDLGRVSVTEVFEGYSIGVPPPSREVRPGDRVRLSSGKVKLAVATFATGVKPNLVEAFVHELVKALGATGRFQVVLGDQLVAAAEREGIAPGAILEGKGLPLARRLKIDHLLAAHVTRVQNRPYVEVRFFGPPRAEPLLSTGLYVPSSIRPAPQGQYSAGGREPVEPKGAARSFLARLLGGEMEAGQYSSGQGALALREIARFPFAVMAMDVAVAPRDGVPRVAVSDGSRVYLYRLANQVLEPEWTFSRTLGQVLSVQLADLDGDGELEAVVNQHHRERGFASTVLTAPGGKVRVLADGGDVILLALDQTGDGVKRTLWGQGYSEETFFSSKPVHQLAIKDGSLVNEQRVPVPAGFRPLGTTLTNINGKTGGRALAYIDAQQRLRVWAGFADLWSSSTAVGGGYVRAEVYRQTDRAGRSSFHAIDPFPLAVDLDGDGVEEILIPQNRVEGVIAVVYKGPAGIRLQPINSGHEGAIIALGAIPSPTSPAIIAAVVRFRNVLKTEGDTQLIMTVPD